MARIIVEYNPQITDKTRKLIGENVTASMESSDGTSHQYEIGAILDSVVFTNDFDKELIEDLQKEGVHYIEI